MILQIERKVVRQAVVDYVAKRLLGDASLYDIDNSKVVITKGGTVDVTINLKSETLENTDEVAGD